MPLPASDDAASVVIIDDDDWWRRHIARKLAAAGFQCHPYEGNDYTPLALDTWQASLGLTHTAAIVDIILDTDDEPPTRRASFDAVAAWRNRGLSPRPLVFISSSEPASWEMRLAHSLGGHAGIIKQQVESWPDLIRSATAPPA